jgi:phosphatidylcholine synthase
MAKREESGAGPIDWGIHALTASGAVLAFLAFASIEGGRWREALLWLLAALAIDGVDGTLARKRRVAERLPRIDGSALDLVVDYLTYVFVPAWFLWRIGAFPRAVALPVIVLILLSSLYTFARRDMKTEDGYFRGFPALWNVVALYIYFAAPSACLAATIALVLVVLTFAPVHTVHPLRVQDYGRALPGITAVWVLSTLSLFLALDGTARTAAVAVSLVSAAILVGLGFLRTLRERRNSPG